MLAKLFKPKWQHPESKIRCLAVRQMKVAKLEVQQILKTMLEQDSHNEVRLVVAMKLLPVDPGYLSLVLKLWCSGFQDRQWVAYQDELIASCLQLLEEAKTRQVCIKSLQSFAAEGSSEAGDILKGIIRLLKTAEPIIALLPWVEDVVFLRDMVRASPVLEVRQTAVDAISDPQVLKSLQVQYKGRDKAMFRMVKNRLQALSSVDVPEAAAQELIKNEAVLKVGFVEKIARHAVQDTVTVEKVQIEQTNESDQRIESANRVHHAESAAKKQSSSRNQKWVGKMACELEQVAERLQAGNVREARKQHQACRQQLNTWLDEGLIKKHHDVYQRWLELKKTFDHYRDWQHFAIVPKKQALIAQMQALIEAPLPDHLQSERIKRLQADWKGLGVADRHQEAQLWEQFQTVSDAAFAKCQQYFDAQSELRQQHLDTRKALVEQLERYVAEIDWSRAQWRKVATTLRLSRQQWREAFPISSFKENKLLQKRFDQACDLIKKKLDEHRDRMAAQKKRLLQEMQFCVEAVAKQQLSLVEGVEKAKMLQKQWSQMDYTHAALEKTLSAQLQQAADPLFQQQNAEKAQQQALKEDHLGQALEIISSIKALNAVIDSDASEVEKEAAEKKAVQLTTAFAELGNFPKQKAEALRVDFEQALTSFQNQVQQIKAAKRLQQFERVWCLNEKLSELETAYLFEEENLPQRIQSIKADWATMVVGLPDEANVIMNTRFDAFLTWSNTQTQASLKAVLPDIQIKKRQLAIRMEILADIASPDTEQDQRLALQVERLNEKFTRQKAHASFGLSGQLIMAHDYMLQWCQLSPNLLDTKENGFAHRFYRAYQLLI